MAGLQVRGQVRMPPRHPAAVARHSSSEPGRGEASDGDASHGKPRHGIPSDDDASHGKPSQGEPSPGVMAGEAARSVNHASHGVQGISQAAREAEAISHAAREASAVRTAFEAANVVVTAEAAEDGANVARLTRAERLARDASKVAVSVGTADAAEKSASAHAAHGPHGRLFKVLAGVGVAGGALQMAEGVHGLTKGKRGEAAKNLLAGAGYAGSGIAELALAPRIAGRLAAPLAGAAAMVEGIYDIARGVAHPDREHVILGITKAAGGAMLSASPFVAGALAGVPIGVGLALVGTGFVAGAVVYENAATFASWGRTLAGKIKRLASPSKRSVTYPSPRV